MKTIFRAILFILVAYPLFTAAQASYRFEQSTGTYTELSGATVIQNPNFGSGDFHLIDLTGETFRFYKIPFKFGGIKTFYLQTNGNLRIDNDSSTVIIDGAFIYLDSIDNSSEISYKVEGNSGNKIVKTQWKNVKIRTGQAGNFINFQIWVYQATGIIEVHYGPSSANNASGYTESGAASGPNVGIFYAPDNLSSVYEKLWLNNEPASLLLDSGKNFVFKALKGVPPNGAIYKFLPNFSMVTSPEIESRKYISVYPNPAGNEINFTEAQSGIITDITGKTMLTYTETNIIEVSTLATGVYIIKTDSGGITRFIKK